MSIHRRSLSLGSFILLGACFSPGAQLTDATSDATTNTTSTNTTSPDTATEPTTDHTSAATAVTTGGSCDCSPLAPQCTPSGDCVNCAEDPNPNQLCGIVEPTKPFCDTNTGLCVECNTTVDCSQSVPQVCDPEGQICVECVKDTDCTADAALKVCDSGTCVGCIVDADCPLGSPTQYCDGGTCGSCVTHDECKSGACEIDRGKCFPVDSSRHWYIDTNGSVSQTGECSERKPCPKIIDAFAGIATAPDTHHIVHVADGTYKEGFGLTTDGVRVAVLAVGDTLIQSESGNPVIMAGVMPPSPLDIKLYLQGLTITGIGSTAVVCQSVSFLGLEDITVRDLEGNGLLTADCTVWSRRSQFLRNFGGLSMSASTVRLENSIISGSTTTPALTVSALSELEILYSTVAQQAGVPTTLLKCGGDPGTVTIRNSALLHDAIPSPIDCLATITTANSAVSSAALDIGPPAGNKVLGADQVSPNFVDWAGSDLHVVDNVTALKDVALWKTGDPLTDIDGEARPNVDQALDVAGADVPGG